MTDELPFRVVRINGTNYEVLARVGNLLIARGAYRGSSASVPGG
jgi:hypothetical protein